MARLGYGARGAIYLLIGGNALAAIAGGQKPHGFTDALQVIGSAPLRIAVALVLLAGLGCFAGYFLIRGFRDLARQRGKRHRLAAAGLIGDAAIYIGFVGALASAAFNGQGGGEGQTRSWFAWTMHLPFGRVLLGLVGVVICGCGLAYLAWGLSADLERDLSLPLARSACSCRSPATVSAAAAWRSHSSAPIGLWPRSMPTRRRRTNWAGRCRMCAATPTAGSSCWRSAWHLSLRPVSTCWKPSSASAKADLLQDA
jgi:hypothetical protein